jgi:PAS domain S-box-containing protein
MEVNVNLVRSALTTHPEFGCDSSRSPDRADRMLTALLDATVDGILVTDARGRIETVNSAAERLLGYRAEEVVGLHLSLLTPAPCRDEYGGSPPRFLSTWGRRKDGSEFPVRLAVGEASLGHEHKFTVILHDLSATVRLEQQVRQHKALATLGEMAAVIAHEVRNPLAGIRGAIQILADRLPAESHDAPILGEIVKRIDALNGLVQDVLLFARPPQPKIGVVEVEPLVRATAVLLAGDPTVKNVTVDVDASAALITADPELLKIVFLNLLVNAAHAMQGQGVIRVSIRCDRGFCNIVFIDSGPGVPPSLLEKIFIPFFTTKARGTGLGLPTAKRLIEAHGGAISVECAPAGGTSVTVQLPLAAMPAAVPAMLEPA